MYLKPEYLEADALNQLIAKSGNCRDYTTTRQPFDREWAIGLGRQLLAVCGEEGMRRVIEAYDSHLKHERDNHNFLMCSDSTLLDRYWDGVGRWVA